jgi:uncharacterized protein YndB with AHSA1/START domain
MAEAELARFLDRWTVEYVRVFAHPIERVWRAITNPAEFRVWFVPGRLDLNVGGEFWFGDDGFTGTVLKLDPPRFVRFSGPAKGDSGYFQYELSEADGGTRMRFVQHFDPAGAHSATPDDLGGDLPVPGTPWKPGFVGGWHEFWDALGDHLDGAAVGSRLAPTPFHDLAHAWTVKMARMGAFTDQQAARASLSLRRHERWNELNDIYRAHIRAAVPPADGEE